VWASPLRVRVAGRRTERSAEVVAGAAPLATVAVIWVEPRVSAVAMSPETVATAGFDEL
jgi:hypothetical protein